MKEKNHGALEKASLFFVLILCGVMLVLSFSDTVKYISAKDRFNLEGEVQSAKREVELLKNRRNYMADKVSEMEFALNDLSVQFDELLRAELIELQALAGDQDLCGPGVVIFVQDGTRELQSGESVNNVLVHDGDISAIVEELRSAGAEAISVNDERVILGASDIVCVGPVIKVNDKRLAPPYIIKAIGDRKTLEATMNVPGGYLDMLKGYGIRVELNTAKYLEIKRLRGIAK